MSSSFLRALFIAVTLSSVVSLEWAKEVRADEIVSAKMAVPLKRAEQAINRGQYVLAEQAIRDAEAIPSKTAYEQNVIEQMRAALAIKQNKTAEAIRAYDQLIASKQTDQQEKIRLMATQISLAYRAKLYGSAIKSIKEYMAAGGKNPYMTTLLIQSYFLQQDYKSAMHAQQQQIDQEMKAGQQPAESQWQILANCQEKLGDQKGVLNSYVQLATHYPKSQYWKRVLADLSVRPGLSSGLQLEIWRLRDEAGLIKTADDYMSVAEIAVQAGVPQLGLKIINRVYSSGVAGVAKDSDRITRLRKYIGDGIKQSQQTLAKQIVEAQQANNGNQLLMLGYNQVIGGNTKQGLSLMEQAFKKKLPHIKTAQLHLAMAERDAGEKTEAIKMLRSITGDGVAAEIAQLRALKESVR